MLVLTCLSFSACNAEYTITKIRQDSYTLKAFRRQGGGGFLKAERSGEDGPFNVSFTGKSTGPGTGEYLLLNEVVNYSQRQAKKFTIADIKLTVKRVSSHLIDMQTSNECYGFT